MTLRSLSLRPKESKAPVDELTVQDAMAELNRVVHEPARLAILTVLSACASADFTFLQTATGLSKGNLSVQLTRLEEAALIKSEKVIEMKRTLTTLTLTSTGRRELEEYWRRMELIRRHATAAAKTAVVKAEKTLRGVAGERLIAEGV